MKIAKKFWQAFWLPILGVTVTLVLFISSAMIQNQKNQDELIGKLNNLEQKIFQLESQSKNQLSLGLKNEKQEIAQTEDLNVDKKANEPEQKTVEETNNATPATEPGKPSPQPVPVSKANVKIGGLGEYSVELKEKDTAFDILLRTAEKNNFSVKYSYFEGIGYFVEGIAGTFAHDNYYWAFYFNGAYSMVGASAQPVSDGDITEWKFENW